MKLLKISLFIQVTLLVGACGIKQKSYLSTSEALDRYSTVLGDQSFYVFPERKNI